MGRVAPGERSPGATRPTRLGKAPERRLRNNRSLTLVTHVLNAPLPSLIVSDTIGRSKRKSTPLTWRPFSSCSQARSKRKGKKPVDPDSCGKYEIHSPVKLGIMLVDELHGVADWRTHQVAAGWPPTVLDTNEFDIRRCPLSRRLDDVAEPPNTATAQASWMRNSGGVTFRR